MLLSYRPQVKVVFGVGTLLYIDIELYQFEEHPFELIPGINLVYTLQLCM